LSDQAHRDNASPCSQCQRGTHRRSVNRTRQSQDSPYMGLARRCRLRPPRPFRPASVATRPGIWRRPPFRLRSCPPSLVHAERGLRRSKVQGRCHRRQSVRSMPDCLPARSRRPHPSPNGSRLPRRYLRSPSRPPRTDLLEALTARGASAPIAFFRRKSSPTKEGAGPRNVQWHGKNAETKGEPLSAYAG
jgi:hypothetical protein